MTYTTRTDHQEIFSLFRFALFCGREKDLQKVAFDIQLKFPSWWSDSQKI